MVCIRKKNVEDAKEIGMQLKRIGKELHDYGMIGYGETIKTHASRLLQLLSDVKE